MPSKSSSCVASGTRCHRGSPRIDRSITYDNTLVSTTTRDVGLIHALFSMTQTGVRCARPPRTPVRKRLPISRRSRRSSSSVYRHPRVRRRAGLLVRLYLEVISRCSPCERSHQWLWMYRKWRDGTRADVGAREECLDFHREMQLTRERVSPARTAVRICQSACQRWLTSDAFPSVRYPNCCCVHRHT